MPLDKMAMGRAIRKCTLIVAAASAFLLYGSCPNFAQHINSNANTRGRAQAEGTLAVTLTVVSSVGVVTGPDGQQRIVVANAAAASDNVSSVQYVRLNAVNSSSGVVSQSSGKSARKARRK